MTTRPPRAPRVLLALILAGAAIALLHPVTRAWLPVPVLLALAAWTVSIGAIAWRGCSRCWRIECIGQRWHLDPVADRRARGLRDATLLGGGFRAGSHMVMPFRDERGRRLSLVLWRDAVAPEAFSRLCLAVSTAGHRTGRP